MFHSHEYSNLRDSFFLRGGCDFGPKDSKQICNYVYSVLKKIIIFWHGGNGGNVSFSWIFKFKRFISFVMFCFFLDESNQCEWRPGRVGLWGCIALYTYIHTYITYRIGYIYV